MAKDVVMPVLGMAQDEGLLVRWLYPSGAAVTKDTPLMEVETDKAVVQVDSPASGVLGDVTLGAGKSAPVGTVIARIYEEGEQRPPDAAGSRSHGPDTVSGASGEEATTVAGRLPTAPAPVQAPERVGRTSGGKASNADVSESSSVPPRPLASGKARRIAREHGIDLAALSGRGPNGAVLAADVSDLLAREAAERGGAAPAIASPVPDTVTFRGEADVTELLRIQQRLAEGAWEGLQLHDLLALVLTRASDRTLDKPAEIAIRRYHEDGAITFSRLGAGRRSLLEIVDCRAGNGNFAEDSSPDIVFHDSADSPVFGSSRGPRGSLTIALGRLQPNERLGRPSVAFEVSAAVHQELLALRLAREFARYAEDPGLLIVEKH